jgi:hypothetical protein
MVEELELGLKKFVFIQILINLKYAGIKYWIKKNYFHEWGFSFCCLFKTTAIRSGTITFSIKRVQTNLWIK